MGTIMRTWIVWLWYCKQRLYIEIFFLKKRSILDVRDGRDTEDAGNYYWFFCSCCLSGVIKAGIMLPYLRCVFSGSDMQKCNRIWCKILQGRITANRVFNINPTLETILPNFTRLLACKWIICVKLPSDKLTVITMFDTIIAHVA